MSDVDSPDHIFSALEVLSDSADTDYVDRDNHRAPTYADDPILMCSIPDTPSPSDSICSAVIATVASPPLGQPLDLSSGKDDRSKSLKGKSPAETKGRLTGAKISSCDSEEEKHDDSVEDKCIDSQNITTSFAPHATGGSDDPKVGDDSGETMAPPKKQRFDFLDVLMMTSKKLDQRFEDTDILEIAAMKGIHFPPPRWWRPGGYGAEDHQNHANGAG